MPELFWWWFGVSIFLFCAFFLLHFACMADYNKDHTKENAKYVMVMTRLMWTAPLFPLWLPFFIIKGIVALFREQFRNVKYIKERGHA